jgi:glycosyltransferase involved in cell wall biosynthesis
LTTIALDIRFRVASGSSIALQNLSVCLVRQAPPEVRFVAVRYRDQDLPPELDALDAVVVPKMPAPLELIWNEVRLPGLLTRQGVDLYHGMKQCAPLLLRCPSVHTVDAIKRGSKDDLPIPLGPKLYFGWHVCYIYKRSNHLLPVSQHVGDFLINELRIDPGRITVVRNGVHAKFLDSNRADADEADNPLGIDKPFMVCIGSVIPLKNQLAVVEALSKIADRVPHHLAILGREDPGYARQIRDAAEAGGIADRLHWVGFVDADGLMCHLHAADAMVHVSRTEGFCLATGEAMACGLPLVLADRGALREQCDNAALYIDDPDDHDALADQLLRVLTNPDQRETMRQRGLKRAASLSWPEAARKTLDVYHRLLHSA